jgi:CSLREA domain-containing protein
MKRDFFGVAVVTGLIGALVVLSSPVASAATITVTTAVDEITPNSGTVSLREAITAINAGNSLGDPDIVTQNPGTFGTNDTINFNIAGSGVKTINVGANASASGIPLPTITKKVVINGYTQGVAAVNTLANSGNAVILIELNGASAGAAKNGLVLGSNSGGSTIRGLAINRFTGNGIVIQSSGNTISGNFIGTNPGGGTRMPNGTFPTAGDGVLIQNASNNIIGTPAVGDRNVISGNAINGVHIVGTTSLPATGNKVQGNFIGIDKGGINGVGNRTEPAPAPGTTEGNNLFGVEISGGNNNTIGGTVAGARNVIGFNGDGIVIDNGGQQNIIQGNFIGVGANGVTSTPNLLHGVSVRSSNGFGPPLGPAQANEPGTSFNTIGGTTASSGNLIEFNGSGGVAVFGNPVSASSQANVGNVIEGNSIFQNGRSFQTASSAPTPLLGIDLTNGFFYPRDDGATPNDSKGHNAANTPNNFQNFPVLTGVISNGGTTNIAGTLTSAANSSYRIEFYSNDADPLGLPAEGQVFLGFATVNTNASGSASFNLSFNLAVANNRIVTATATDSVGNTSEFAAGIPVPSTAQALNISTRMLVQGGNNVLIAGFIIAGSDQKTVGVRGIGPSLSQFFSGTLSDPTLELHTGNTTLATNDNWQDDSTQAAQLSANNLAPSDPKESGIVATLPSGAYTAILAGKSNGTGIGVAEIYDLDQSANSQLANISSRGFVLTNNNVMIGGFILGHSPFNSTIVVRGIGPSLAQFGLSPVLSDPTLELHDGNGVVFATNDNWQDDSAQAAQLSANNLAPSDPNEAAIFTSLPPGQFTAILAGKNGGTGIGVVEVFNLH